MSRVQFYKAYALMSGSLAAIISFWGNEYYKKFGQNTLGNLPKCSPSWEKWTLVLQNRQDRVKILFGSLDAMAEKKMCLSEGSHSQAMLLSIGQSYQNFKAECSKKLAF